MLCSDVIQSLLGLSKEKPSRVVGKKFQVQNRTLGIKISHYDLVGLKLNMIFKGGWSDSYPGAYKERDLKFPDLDSKDSTTNRSRPQHVKMKVHHVVLAFIALRTSVDIKASRSSCHKNVYSRASCGVQLGL